MARRSIAAKRLSRKGPGLRESQVSPEKRSSTAPSPNLPRLLSGGVQVLPLGLQGFINDIKVEGISVPVVPHPMLPFP